MAILKYLFHWQFHAFIYMISCMQVKSQLVQLILKMIFNVKTFFLLRTFLITAFLLSLLKWNSVNYYRFMIFDIMVIKDIVFVHISSYLYTRFDVLKLWKSNNIEHWVNNQKYWVSSLYWKQLCNNKNICMHFNKTRKQKDIETKFSINNDFSEQFDSCTFTFFVVILASV